MDINFDKAHFGRRKRTAAPELSVYNIMRKHKIQNLVKLFINKLRMNSVHR